MLQHFRHTTIWTGIVSILVLSLTVACDNPNEGKDKQDKLVAQVFNKSLFQSELNELITEGTSNEDSTKIANAYLEKWVREAVLMHEAEKYVPKDLNIDELVRDYRASLIRHNYEKLLVDLNMDSLVNEQELNDYYEEYKEQYKLKQPIIKCQMVKVQKPAENWNEFEQWWKSDAPEDYKRIVEYCSRSAEVYMLNDSIWYELDDVSRHLPKNKLTTSNYSSVKNINTSDDDYEYLVRIYETVPGGEYAPLGFIQDQAKKVILHKRKISLLEEKKEEMFERATRKNNVKIYVDR